MSLSYRGASGLVISSCATIFVPRLRDGGNLAGGFKGDLREREDVSRFAIGSDFHDALGFSIHKQFHAWLTQWFAATYMRLHRVRGISPVTR